MCLDLKHCWIARACARNSTLPFKPFSHTMQLRPSYERDRERERRASGAYSTRDVERRETSAVCGAEVRFSRATSVRPRSDNDRFRWCAGSMETRSPALAGLNDIGVIAITRTHATRCSLPCLTLGSANASIAIIGQALGSPRR